MKGIVFNLFEEVVSHQYGEEMWDDLLAAAGLEGAYTSLGSYPDAELFRLVGAASCALDVPPDDLVRWFGRKALPHFAHRYPHFFTPHRAARSFVLSLNDIIHPEVRKLYPGADVPVFGFDTSSAEVLVLSYRSPRKLCAFAVGLIEGTAAQFGEGVAIVQPRCMNRGDERCVLEITFAPTTPAPR